MKILSDMTFIERFAFNFLEDDRWRYITDGLKNTLVVTFFALILGILLGSLVALIRTTHDKTGTMKIPDFFAKIYLTAIRGTPVLIQVLIIYFVVFKSVNVDKVVAASIAFGINSGAYVAEIFRSGIMSIDRGQSEAGRSLGLNYNQTMFSIVMPQAIKNILPALGNEFIVLIKETSVASVIALQDLTHGANIIRGRTFDPTMPLFAAALIYLVIVLGLERVFITLERRMARSDYR